MIERDQFYGLEGGQVLIDSNGDEWLVTSSTPTNPPHTHNYGTREITVIDPEGEERFLGWKSEKEGTGICDDTGKFVPELNDSRATIREED